MFEDHDLLDRVARREEVISVLGLGHVGLPTGLSLAESGWQVVGVDSDAARVRTLQDGQIPFFEPELDELLQKHLSTGRFRISDDVDQTIREGRILFICVGTPQGERGDPDLSQVESVTRSIAGNLDGYKLIIEKSTVPAITGQWIRRTIERYAGSAGDTSEPVVFDVVSNPEFLQEGSAVQDCLHPDRIVCGVESEFARKLMEEIYRSHDCPLLFTDVSSAELIKHAANAFLATKVSFINMVADLCEEVGGNVDEVASGIGLDSRIGSQFLKAGIGFGGYCLPKDLRAFIYLAEQNGADFSLLQVVDRINTERTERFLKKVKEAVWVVREKRLGILGLAFKPGTDDIREAPSVKIVQSLLDDGAILRLHDPQAMDNVKAVFGIPGTSTAGLTFCESAYEAAQGAHALLVLTEWNEYSDLDLKRLRDEMEVPLIIDGRNLFDPDQMRAAGFEYMSIGR